MALERIEEGPPIECMNNFSVSGHQESGPAALLACANSLVDAGMLIDTMCSDGSLPSGSIQSSSLPLNDNIQHSFENSCTFELKDSDLRMMKPFFSTDLNGHDLCSKHALNHIEQLGLIPSPCNVSTATASEQVVLTGTTAPTIHNQTEMTGGCEEDSMLLKLDPSFCYVDEELCRLCASKGFCLLPLFHGEGVKLNLVDKIHRCLPIKVSVGDGLPTQVCTDCSTKLQICDDLISTSITALGKLEAIKSIKAESINFLQNEDEILAHHDNQTILKVHEKPYGVLEDIATENIISANNNLHVEVSDEKVTEVNDAFVLSDCESEWICNKCNFKAKCRTTLTFHEQQKHSCDLELPATEEDVEEISSNQTTLTSFSCTYCDESFQSKINWEEHELSHTRLAMQENNSIVLCDLCEKEFHSIKAFKDHYKAAHDEKPTRMYSCDQCDKSYKVSSSLDVHKATHSKETPYLCDLCGKSFKHNSNLRSHKRLHSEDASKHRHRCDLCHKAFPSKFHLSEHRNVHLNITPYSCTECDKKFHRRTQLRQHTLTHATGISYECPQCPAQFNRRGNLTQHIKRHVQEKKFICKICKISFQSLSEVVQHRRSHSPQEVMAQVEEKILHSCDQCSKIFPTLNRLEEHIKTHCGLKFECSLCNKKLSNRRTLEYHMRSFHTGERPYVCRFCPGKFLSKEARIVHERLHTGEKPYSCSICGMGFRCSSNLNQHLRIHTEDRPWMCDHCPKTFKRKGILLVHMRTHTGDKPFCCDKCGRRFTQKNDMLKHQQTHNSVDRMVSCSSCNWTFESNDDLHSHILSHHSLIQMGIEGNSIPSHQSQAGIIAPGNLAEYPLLLENGENIIVHQMSHSNNPEIQVDPRQPNTQLMHITDPLMHSVISEPQVLLQSSGEPQIIQFGEDAVILQTSENTLM